MTKKRRAGTSPGVNVGTTALVLDDGRRIEPGASFPADTPEDRITYWTQIGAVGPKAAKPPVKG
jgi:hypothetical protein